MSSLPRRRERSADRGAADTTSAHAASPPAFSPRASAGPVGFGASAAALAAAHVTLKHDDLLEPEAYRRGVDARFPLSPLCHDPRVRGQFLHAPADVCVADETARSIEAHNLYHDVKALCETHGITALKLFPPFVFETVAELTRRRVAIARGGDVDRHQQQEQQEQQQQQQQQQGHDHGASEATANAAVAADDQAASPAASPRRQQQPPQCFAPDLSSRDFLLPQDVGVAVVDRATGEAVGEIASVRYVRGVGNVAVFTETTSPGDDAPREAQSAPGDGDIVFGIVERSLAELRPATPILLHVDTLLPCGEIIPDGNCPVSVRDITLTMLYEKHGVKMSSKMKVLISWNVSEAFTTLAAAARRRLAAQMAIHRLPSFVPSPAAEVRISRVAGAGGSLLLVPDDDLDATSVVERRGSDQLVVSCGILRHAVLRSHVGKLRSMYDGVCGATIDPNGEFFTRRLFVLLTRYFSLTGAHDAPAHEAAWHCAVPPVAMRVLQSRMDASLECFASPLNAFARRFCSAFPDTDCFFGSIGSFFEFNPVSGSFQTGPPYDHQLSHAMFDHICELFERKGEGEGAAALGAGAGPLSFTVTMPYSDRPVAQKVLQRVRDSGYVRVDVKLDEHRYAYVDGYQQCDANRGFVLRCATRVVVVQNEAGAARWPAEEPVREFMAAWAGAVVSSSTVNVSSGSS